MSNKLLLKKSSVVAKVPLTTDLDYGELALNYADGKLYFKNSSNVIQNFSIGGGDVTLAGTQTLTNKTISGSSNTITNISLTTAVTGTLPVTNGGTGATTNTDARTNLGATTVGANIFTLTNPSAITFPRFNADNTVSSLDAATFRTAIGAGTSSTTGTVTSVGGTGTVSGLTLTGTVTATGNLTLGGTLAVTASNFASQTANTFLSAPNGSAGVPTFRSIVAADVPTLNQNTTGYSKYITFVDGPRDLSNRLPNTSARSVFWDFVSAGTANGSGNYGGVMSFAPWDGTTASTGDSSYQLAFANTTGLNASGQPKLSIRNGIDTTWNAWYTLLHSGNYNSYSPTLTGTGASGTWGISITGNAATATSASSIDGVAFNNSGSANPVSAPDSLDSNGIGYVTSVSLLGQTDGALYSQAYSSSWQHQIYGDYRTGQMAIRGKNSNTWQAWRTVLDSSNYNSYSPTLTGTGASGTWGINVSGTAGSAATLTTARTINGSSFNGSANIVVPLLYDENYRRITNPGGAEYVTSTTSVTGAIAITLPVGMTSTMVRMTIKVYEYLSNRSFEIHCGGYNYPPGTTWANNPFAYIVGNPSIDRRFTVRFGYDSTSTKAVIYIGELASTWSYPQVFVTDVQLGFSGNSISWTTGWSIGFESTAFQNVTATITNSQVGYATSTNTADATVLRDGSGNFSAGTITASLSGNATNVTGTVAVANGGTGATTNTAARTNLGATTVGANLFTLTNPSAISFPRFNADNTVSSLDAATFRTAIGAGTSSTTVTITDDTTTNATRYILFDDITSGSVSTVGVSSSKLYYNPSTGTLNATDFNSLSDTRLKYNVEQLDQVDALAIIDQLNPVSFQWLGNDQKAYGVIAQEIEQILPEIVETNTDNDIKSVSYMQLIPILLQAVKQLTEQVRELKAGNR